MGGSGIVVVRLGSPHHRKYSSHVALGLLRISLTLFSIALTD